MSTNGHHRRARVLGTVAPPSLDRLESLYQDRLSRLQEGYDLWDRWPRPGEYWSDQFDGGPGRGPFLPAGTLYDRRGGKDWPLLATEVDLREFRAWSRLLCETNYLAIGFLDRLVEFGVGDGYTWQVQLRGAAPSAVYTGTTGASTPEPVRRCQRVLDEWRELASWGGGPAIGDPTNPDDDTGIIQDREQEAFKRWRRDGEDILRFFDGGRDTEYLPTVRWIEPEQVGTPPGEATDGPYSFGILTDADDRERRLEYFVRDPNGTGMDGERVPSGRIVHMTANTDATIKRGLPDFFPLHDDLQRVKKLLRNMGEVSAILSAIAYLRQHAPTTTQTQVQTLIAGGKDVSLPRRGATIDGRTIPGQYTQPGTVHDVSNGMQYVPPPMIAGTPGFLQVTQAILRAAGARWGMPEFFSGDASNNNYASILVSGGPFERATKARQKQFAAFERAIAYKVLAFACRAGRLDEADVRSVEVKIVTPGVAITDKDKEAQTRAMLVREKLLSPQTAMAQAGEDPAAEMANMKAFAEQFPDATAGLFGGADDGLGMSNPRLPSTGLGES